MKKTFTVLFREGDYNGPFTESRTFRRKDVRAVDTVQRRVIGGQDPVVRVHLKHVGHFYVQGGDAEAIANEWQVREDNLNAPSPALTASP